MEIIPLFADLTTATITESEDPISDQMGESRSDADTNTSLATEQKEQKEQKTSPTLLPLFANVCEENVSITQPLFGVKDGSQQQQKGSSSSSNKKTTTTTCTGTSVSASIAADDKKHTTRTRLAFQVVADGIKSKQFRRIVILCGAGISVNAGIPDFRSPGCGIYDVIQKRYGGSLMRPEDMFDLHTFIHNPHLFYDFVNELNIENAQPTPTHRFFRLLEEHGLLQRIYTQNIDGLEAKTKITDEKTVLSHGTMSTAHCLKCKKMYHQQPQQTLAENKNDENDDKKESSVKKKKNLYGLANSPYCDACQTGIVKPDIVFFGEDLPESFYAHKQRDLVDEADLVLIMGTSLSVYPFASLIHQIPATTPRVYINKTSFRTVRDDDDDDGHTLHPYHIKNTNPFKFGNGTDYFVCTETDFFIQQVCDELGWSL